MTISGRGHAETTRNRHSAAWLIRCTLTGWNDSPGLQRRRRRSESGHDLQGAPLVEGGDRNVGRNSRKAAAPASAAPPAPAAPSSRRDEASANRRSPASTWGARRAPARAPADGRKVEDRRRRQGRHADAARARERATEWDASCRRLPCRGLDGISPDRMRRRERGAQRAILLSGSHDERLSLRHPSRRLEAERVHPGIEGNARAVQPSVRRTPSTENGDVEEVSLPAPSRAPASPWGSRSGPRLSHSAQSPRTSAGHWLPQT